MPEFDPEAANGDCVDRRRIKAASAVIDGEIVVPDRRWHHDFAALQKELKGSSKTIVLVAFDLL